jgi:hypothetical protein
MEYISSICLLEIITDSIIFSVTSILEVLFFIFTYKIRSFLSLLLYIAIDVGVDQGSDILEIFLMELETDISRRREDRWHICIELDLDEGLRIIAHISIYS